MQKKKHKEAFKAFEQALKFKYVSTLKVFEPFFLKSVCVAVIDFCSALNQAGNLASVGKFCTGCFGGRGVWQSKRVEASCSKRALPPLELGLLT